ncbi:MAG: SUMF1/EgtB/PvdO family nonheme iron enzyme [Planctomycetes bacterium]|nr:SUMF1/EgtB/PvdO family nonheme iron enzyme [Planctomycetota bacterium]
MPTQGKIVKWARQLNSKVPFLTSYICRTACRKLAANTTTRTVPFLISAIANSDEEVRRIAEGALRSLNIPEAIDTLLLGYIFTKKDSLHQILTVLGRTVPEDTKLPVPQPYESIGLLCPAERAWQFQNSKDDTLLAFVPEGDFLAGAEGFGVHLYPYYLALACVTNAQYARFLTERRPDSSKLACWINIQRQDAAIHKENSIYKVDPEKAELPVVWVTWNGAVAYCKWADLRLPTELEWEKGARGVDGRLYPWGDEWEAGRPQPPAGKLKQEEITSVWAYPTARSPYGLYQMIGNIHEWCADSYAEDAYQRYSQGDLRPPRHGEHKVLRGGPWRFGTPVHLRTEYRKSTVWRAGTPLCGFRCAKSL